jgi:hypothetical protein
MTTISGPSPWPAAGAVVGTDAADTVFVRKIGEDGNDELSDVYGNNRMDGGAGNDQKPTRAAANPSSGERRLAHGALGTKVPFYKCS